MSVQKLEEKTGFDFSLIYFVNSTPQTFPLERGKYKCAVKAVSIKGVKNGQNKLVFICVTPKVANLTYVGNIALSALKTLYVRSDTANKDFSDKMEYFILNLEDRSDVDIFFLDALGNKMTGVEGFIHLDVFECKS